MGQENQDTSIGGDDESRRSFMKKGALASSAVALGAAGSGMTAADSDLQQQQPGQGLVFSYDYYPGLSFQMVSGLQQPTVNSILSPNGDQPVVDPTDYNGYIVRYQTSENTPGIYSFVFVRTAVGTLSQGTSYRFTADAQFFNNQVNLLEATIESGGGG